MSNYELPHRLMIVSQRDPVNYRVRTFPDGQESWYTEILRNGRSFLMPGHLCGRPKPIRFIVLGIEQSTGWMSLYYGGVNEYVANRVAKNERRYGAFVIKVEELPTPPNKHDYPEYQMRGNPGRPDADRVATEAAQVGCREDAVQG